MKKFFTIFLILFLIFFTASVKNSTKGVDDEIFAKEESIRSLKKDFENVKLEYDYLSSSEKIFEFQNLYFEGELIKKNIQEIRIIDKTADKFKLRKLKLINDK